MSKILIVDDEDKIRELIRLNLELVGYECKDVSNGEENIELTKKERILICEDLGADLFIKQ